MKKSYCILWKRKRIENEKEIDSFEVEFYGAYAPVMQKEYERRYLKTFKQFTRKDFIKIKQLPKYRHLKNKDLSKSVYQAFGDCPCGLQLRVLGEMGYNFISHNESDYLRGKNARDNFQKDICKLQSLYYAFKNSLYGFRYRYNPSLFMR